MASRGVNKVILLGRLGGDPEVRVLNNGDSVTTLSVATSEEWKDKSSGEKKEKTEWHRVVIFGKLAEIAGKYLKKGSQVYFEGKLQTRKWQDNAGVDRYSTEIVINVGSVMQMIGSAPGAEGGNSGGSGWGKPVQPTHSGNQSAKGYDKTKAGKPEEPPMDFDDDIPF